MRAFVLAVTLLALAGCAGDDKPVAQTPPPKPTTVIDPQLKALERAKAVQGQVDAHKVETDAKLREAEGQ